jgi:hypothetical protein
MVLAQWASASALTLPLSSVFSNDGFPDAARNWSIETSFSAARNLACEAPVTS